MTNAKRDDNGITALLGTSNADGVTLLPVYVDSSTNRLLVNATITGSITASFTLTTDGASFTASTDGGLVAMGFYHSTIDTVADGKSAAIAIDSKRNQFVVIRDAAGNARGVNIDANNNLGAVLAAETTKVIGTVRNVGNIGAVFDGVITAATAPANGVMGLGVYNSTEPSPTTGQSVGIQLDAKGRQRQVIMDAAGNTRGANVDANNNLGVVLAAETTKVLGTVRNVGNVGGVFDAVVGAGTAPANMIVVGAIYNSTEISPTTGQSFALQADSKGRIRGVIYDAAGNTRGANVDASNRLSVSIDNIAASQTIATVTTVSTVTTLTTLTGGGVAHDGVDSGNPVKVGARAVATPSTATMVAAADRTDMVSDLDAFQLVRDGYALGDLISERVTDTGGTSTAFSNFGATASTRNYVTVIVVFNSSATAGYVDIRDGTAGSVLYTVPLPAGGGAVISNAGAPLFRSTANTALAYDVSAALTTVYISMTGFKSKV